MGLGSIRRRPAILGLAVALSALVAAPSAAGVEPRGGTWHGKTAQGLPIEFTVKKKPKGWRVVHVEYKVRSTCTGTPPGGSPITTTATTTQELPVLSQSDGRPDEGNGYTQRGNMWTWGFFGGGNLPTGGTHTNLDFAQGKFLDDRKAAGTVRREVDEALPGSPQVQCRSGIVRWTARR